MTSYQTVTIIQSNRKVTYNVIRQTQRRSAYFPDVDFKCCLFSEFDGGIKNGLFASKDGAFSFANEVPGVFEKADKADGFIEITSLKPGHRTSIAAECCEDCRMLVIGY